MKNIYILLLIISFTSLYSQDIILKMNGETITSKIDEIGIDEIKYHRYSNLSGPVFIILKKDVSKITFENGDIEEVNILSSLDIDDVKKIIVENISKFGYEHANPKRAYAASFDNDYLKISIPDIYKSEQSKRGILYDFSEVIEFQRVSKRRNNIAYVNVVVMECRNKNKNKWRKYKLVILVKGHENADRIMNALKDYHRLLNLDK